MLETYTVVASSLSFHVSLKARHAHATQISVEIIS